jgi:hypothetical protein
MWRHPFPGKKFKPKVKKLDQILQRSTRALNRLAQTRSGATKHVENFDYLEYSAHLGIFLGKKYQTALAVQKALNSGRDRYDPAQLKERVASLKDYLSELKTKYETLWIRCARRNGLELILQRFDAAIFFYQQKIQEIENGIIFQDPFLKAEFITASIKVPRGASVFLRKTVSIKKPLKRCLIQGLADMYMRLHTNGELVGEIISKFSLSVEPIRQRIQVFDVTANLEMGNNVVAAECRNFLVPRPAGNILIELEYEDGEKEIIRSGAGWKAATEGSEGWNDTSFNDSDWEGAKSLGAPPRVSGHLTKPYLAAGIKSQDCNYYAVATSFKGQIPWAPLFLIEVGKKIMGLDIF